MSCCRLQICAGFLLMVAGAWAAQDRPQQLQVNYQRAPALGVGKQLRFSWAVPAPAGRPVSGAQPGVQSTYRIVITDLNGANTSASAGSKGTSVWDSGTVHSSQSINVNLDAQSAGLLPGAAYEWTVSCDGSAPSDPATFVTSLWDGFHAAARWVWAQPSASAGPAQHYAHFRHALAGLPPQATITRALLYATAWQEPTMLASFKFYVDGTLVSIGPGRGEADVLNRNSTFLHAPYVTTDVTGIVHPSSVLAIEGMAPLFQAPCVVHACKDYNTAGGGVLAQLVLSLSDGTTTTVSTGGSRWQALPRDAYYKPGPPAVKVPGLDSETAYAKLLEHIDAAQEAEAGQGEWRTSRSLSPPWPAAVESAYQERGALVAKMSRPLRVYRVPPPVVTVVTATAAAAGSAGRAAAAATANGGGSAPAPAASSPSLLIDFGREFQGGVILRVHDEHGSGGGRHGGRGWGASARNTFTNTSATAVAVAGAGGAAGGTRVRIISGSLLLPNGSVDAATGTRLAASNTWGYEMNWTLRDGPQELRQHRCAVARL
jgi:hypothetical protein